MSTIDKHRRGLKARLMTAAAATAVVAGLGAFAAAPAQAAGTYTLHAASDYSRATTSTNNGWEGRSYAQHGSVSSLSAWYNVSSYAFADSGTSSSYAAQVWFRD
ncbi:hypothetical protein ACIGEP_01380 [Microbacterium sp. NPDC077663]|uniref:hypothetical protein n=1 Tax=Microbacterium sp. NPDC077663 TaxID=3364189 RepID=UPI0037C5A9BC